METFVEPSVVNECPEFAPIDLDQPSFGVDFCIALGGDGTVLHLNSLFQGIT